MAVSWIGAHPGNFAKGRRGARPQLIVLHVVEAALDRADAWFNDPSARASLHYTVGRRGDVHQYVQEPDTAVHSGAGAEPPVDLDLYSIAIGHEGIHGVSWPASQRDASHRLVIAAARRWGIPLDDDHIVRVGRDDRSEHAGYMAGLLAAAGGRPGAEPAGLPLRLRARARLRQEPSTSAPVVRVLSAGATFVAASSVTDGEAVEGNPIWHRSPAGEFLWSGATDRLRAV